MAANTVHGRPKNVPIDAITGEERSRQIGSSPHRILEPRNHGLIDRMGYDRVGVNVAQFRPVMDVKIVKGQAVIHVEAKSRGVRLSRTNRWLEACSIRLRPTSPELFAKPLGKRSLAER